MRLRSTLALVALTGILAACGPTANAPTIGATYNLNPLVNDEKVTVVEFSDFNCPACKGAYAVAREIAATPGVHFELRHFPLPIPGHETSPQAAVAYECGKAQKLGEEFASALFENQSENGFSDEFLKALPSKYAFDTRAGFDAKKYETCFVNGETKSLVAADEAAAKSAGISATPTFIVNGETVVGGRDVVAKVEAALKAAKEAPATTNAPTENTSAK